MWIFRFIPFFFLLILSSYHACSQACDPTTPSYTLDLSGNPDSVWISPNTIREGLCCGLDPNASPPIRCVEFFFTLDEEAQGIRFDLASGAIPPGALGYQINCGPYYQVGENICLNGPGPHRLTFCKPGNNKNTYSITSIPAPKVSNPQVVSDGCRGTLIASGFEESSITWTSTPYNAVYNSYLSCTTGCDTSVVMMQTGAPEYIDYEVSGTPLGGCQNIVVSKLTRVYFVNDKLARIEPQDPVICYGGTNATLTAYGSGGAPPYQYLWSTGETSQSITVGIGTYWVQIKDTTSCPEATDSVTVTAYLSPIVANAGPDITSCANNPQATLNGSVQEATGGIWTGGNGTYSPDNQTLTAVYTPTATEITLGRITHILTTTGNGPCPASTDSTIHTIGPAPTANAGTDGEVCANRPAIQLNGNVTIATGGIWSGVSGTFSPDNNTLNAIYIPSADEISAGSITLTLTTTGNGTCLAVADQVNYLITPAPTVNAGNDIIVCSNNPSAQLNGTVQIATGGLWSGGTGIFSPDRNTLNATYSPSASEISAGSVTLTLTTTGNGNCNPVSDDVLISFTPAPTVDAGSDITVCANNSIAQLNGIVTVATGGVWSGGLGVFSPGATSLSASYSPTASEITAGSVILTLTSTGNGNCLPVSDQLSVIFTDAPTVNAGPDQTVCANNALTQLSGNITVATGGTWSGGTGTFSPNRNDLNSTYTPSSAEITTGSVLLTLTTTGNGNCLAVSDNITISITPAPIANAGIDQTVCANNSATQLTGIVTVASGGIWSGGAGTFTPGNTDLNATYEPTAAEILNGSVILELTTTGNNNCNAVSDLMTLNITPAPTINAGADQSVCANNPSLQLTGTVTTATGGMWSGGAGSFSPGPAALWTTYTPSPAEILGGTITLTLTSTGNGNCNPVSDNMTITITPSPEIDAGADQTVCGNNSDVQLNGQVTIASGANWSGGTGAFTPGPGSLNAVYTPSSTDIAAGTVNLTLTSTGNGKCIAVTDQMTIIITPAPVVDAGPDQTVCANNADVQLTGTVSVSTGGIWNSAGEGTFTPGETDLNAVYTPSLFELSSGITVLRLTTTGNGNCLPVTDYMTIYITPAPEVNAGPDQTVCANNADIALSGSVTVTGSGSWSGGNGTFAPDNSNLNAIYTPSATETGTGEATLTLTSTNNGNCLAVSDEVVFTITPAPVVNAGPDFDVCANNAIADITGTVTTASGGIWTGGSGSFSSGDQDLSPTYIPSDAEIISSSLTLTLTSTGNGNCLPVSDQMTLTITPAPTVNAGADVAVCGSDPNVYLAATVTEASGGVWTGGKGTFTPSSSALTTTYTATAEEIAVGTVTLSITTTGNGKCLAVSDKMTISIMDPQPQVSAGSDQQACGDIDSVSLSGWVKVATGGIWSTDGTGTFSPTTSSLNTYYLPSADDKLSGGVTFTLTTTGNEPCPAVADQMLLQFTSIPFIEAGPDQNACSNSVPVLQLEANGSEGRWSGGLGSFAPNDSTLNASYTPDPSEYGTTVRFVITTIANAACDAEKDSLLVTFIDGPYADAGPDREICADSSYIPLQVIFSGATQVQWITSGTGSFDNSTAANPHYIPSPEDTLNGIVSFRVTTTDNGVCEPATDELHISILPAPLIDAGLPESVCADTSYIDITGKISNTSAVLWTTTGSGTFSAPSNLSSSYFPSAGDTTTGFADLIIESTDHGICKKVSDTVRITILPAPVAEAGPDQTICADTRSINLSGTVHSAISGEWTSAGTGTFAPDRSISTSYYTSDQDTTSGSVWLFLTTTGNGYCRPVIDSMNLVINPSPIVNAGPDEVLCADKKTVSLAAVIYHSTGAIWNSSGTGSFSFPSGNLINEYGITPTDTANGLVSLWLESTGNPLCQTVTDYKNVLITPAPYIEAGPDLQVCISQDSILFEGSLTVSTGISWSGNGSGSLTSVTNTSSYYYPTVQDKESGMVVVYARSIGNGGCEEVSDSAILTITPFPVPAAGEDQTICSDSTYIQLSGSVQFTTESLWESSGSGYFSDKYSLLTEYIPSSDDTANGSINMILTAAANDDCPAVKDTVTLTITPAPVLYIGPDITVCANNSYVQLQANYSVASGIEWDGNGIFTPGPTANNPGYNPDANEITAGTALLSATTTGNGMCKAVTDALTITITPAPLVDAGPDQSLCSNNPEFSLNGSVSVSTGGSWTGGTGLFEPDADQLTVKYIPSEQDMSGGTISLILTSTGNGNCFPENDTAQITFTPSPIPDAGPDFDVCANNSVAQLNGTITVAGGAVWTGTGGSFTPSNTSLNAEYAPSSTDNSKGFAILILETTNNGNCLPEKDSLVLTITPAPIVNAGPDFSVCADTSIVPISGSVTVAGGGIWTSNGSGSIQNSGSLNTAYNITPEDTAAGTVVFYLTSTLNGKCNPVIDSSLVQITPAPIINAGSDINICRSENSVALSGETTVATVVAWNSSSNGTFYPSSDQHSTLYSLGNSDQQADSLWLYFSTVKQGLCKPKTDTLLLTFSEIPSIETGEENICADSAGAEFTALFSNSTGVLWKTMGSGQFFPDTTSETVEYRPSLLDISSGTAKLYISTTQSGSCPPAIDTVILTITPTPVSNAGPDITVCADTSYVVVIGSADYERLLTWQTTGSGTFIPDNERESVQYIISAADKLKGGANLFLTVSGNPLCKPVVDTMELIINPSPSIYAGSDTTVCPSLSVIPLKGSVSVATGGIWSGDGSGSFIYNDSSLNNYYVISAGDRSEGIINLRLTSTGNGLCKAVSDVRTILIKPEPFVSAGPHQIVCTDAEAVAFSGTVKIAQGGVWSSSGTGYFTPDTTASLVHYIPSEGDKQDSLISIYYSTTGNSICKAVTDSISLRFVEPPTVDAGVDRTICIQASEIQLTGSVENATGGSWTTKGTGDFNPNKDSLETTYIVSPVDTSEMEVKLALTTTGNEGCFTQDSILITFYPAPYVSLHNIPACDFDTIIVYAIPETVNMAADSGITWYRNGLLLPDTSKSIKVTETGIFSVHYRVGECIVNDTSAISFYPNPVPENNETVVFCKESDVKANLDAGPAAAYLWSTSGTTNQIYEASEPGMHYFEIFNQYGCSTADSIYLKDACPPRIFPSTAFTPNDDEVNDDFTVSGKYFSDFSLTIFNRWGEIIFYSENPKQGWDGNYRNEPMPPGVYPYIVRYKALHAEYNEGEKLISGSVTIIR